MPDNMGVLSASLCGQLIVVFSLISLLITASGVSPIGKWERCVTNLSQGVVVAEARRYVIEGWVWHHRGAKRERGRG